MKSRYQSIPHKFKVIVKLRNILTFTIVCHAGGFFKKSLFKVGDCFLNCLLANVTLKYKLNHLKFKLTCQLAVLV